MDYCFPNLEKAEKLEHIYSQIDNSTLKKSILSEFYIVFQESLSSLNLTTADFCRKAFENNRVGRMDFLLALLYSERAIRQEDVEITGTVESKIKTNVRNAIVYLMDTLSKVDISLNEIKNDPWRKVGHQQSIGEVESDSDAIYVSSDVVKNSHHRVFPSSLKN